MTGRFLSHPPHFVVGIDPFLLLQRLVRELPHSHLALAITAVDVDEDDDASAYCAPFSSFSLSLPRRSPYDNE